MLITTQTGWRRARADTDIFFNTSHKSAVNDPSRRATMAPTASKGEVRKVSLVDYDLQGLATLYGP